MKYIWGTFCILFCNIVLALSPVPPKQGATKGVKAGIDLNHDIPREELIQQLFDLNQQIDIHSVKLYLAKNADLEVADALLERLELEVDQPEVGQLYDLCAKGPNYDISRGVEALLYASNLYPDNFREIKLQLLSHNIDYLALTALLNFALIDSDDNAIKSITQRCSDFFPDEMSTFMNHLYSIHCDGLKAHQLMATLNSDDYRKAQRTIDLFKCFEESAAQALVVHFVEQSWPEQNYWVFDNMRNLNKENLRQFEEKGRIRFKLFKWLVRNELQEPLHAWSDRAKGDLKFVLDAFLLMSGDEKRVPEFKINYCSLEDEKVLSEVNKILMRFKEQC
ncbi:MAG: hypothetical protein HWE27_11025 [Gammaproteobacteria bacterium]|nr:hypothetical protein [Gammaproteobacteria bacterium]